MKKIFILAASLLLLSSAAFAQEVTVAKKGNRMTPSKGDFSIGFTFNPVALSKKLKYQPSVGTFASDWIGAQAEYPHSMFVLSTDPLASLMMKYRFTDHWGIRANIGFTGSRTNYKEYINDDYAEKTSRENQEGGFSEKLVVDVISAKLNAMTIGISAEYTKNFGALSFIAGFGIQYALGGGSMSFKYGNDFIYENGGNRWINKTPTTSSYTIMKKDDLFTFNEYEVPDDQNKKKYAYYGFDTDKLLNGSNVRPTDRYNIGYCNGIGFTCDMGIEWFFAGRMSLTAAITFTPLMILFQPETYATFEGIQAYDITYDNAGNATKATRDAANYEVVEFSHPVSPGSTALLYGTENLGFRIGFNYYL